MKDNSRPRILPDMILVSDCFQETQMKIFSKDNIKCPFLPSLPKYERKSIFCKIVLLLQAQKYFVFLFFSKSFSFHEGVGKVPHYWLGDRGEIGQRKWAIPERNQIEGHTEEIFYLESKWRKQARFLMKKT